jgi:hypothetical protein
MPRRPVNLTSPAPCGAFLFPSSQPCNRAAQAPLNQHRGVPGPPICPLFAAACDSCAENPVRPSPFPFPPRAAQPRQSRGSLPPRPPLPSVRRLPLPRAALCRPVRGFPFPCPVRRPAAGTVKPLSPACRRPRAAPEGRQPPPPPIPCRRPAVRRRLKVGFTNPR